MPSKPDANAKPLNTYPDSTFLMTPEQHRRRAAELSDPGLKQAHLQLASAIERRQQQNQRQKPPER